MKTIFLISGFTMNRSTADAPFEKLRDMLTSKGYRVVPVPFTWNHQTLSSFVKRFIRFYRENKGDYNLIMGGSFGAMATFLAAPQVNPDEIVLCSLSAFFSEDLNHYDQSYLLKKFGRRRLNDLAKISAHRLGNLLQTSPMKITLTYGEKEKSQNPLLVSRVKQTASAIANARIIELKDAGHKMREHEYIAGLRRVL